MFFQQKGGKKICILKTLSHVYLQKSFNNILQPPSSFLILPPRKICLNNNFRFYGRWNGLNEFSI